MDFSIPPEIPLTIQVSDRTYLKDPNTSELGRKILRFGIDLIDLYGFEGFTFKKLADHIESSEASIYRYFDSKHKLLVFLMAWYWIWLDHMVLLNTLAQDDPLEKLRRTIATLAAPFQYDKQVQTLDTRKLHRIVIAESPKAYLSKEVDTENREGYFIPYKRLCARVAEIFRHCKPDYPYPTTLVSTLIEAAHHQMFFSEHLPRLTDIREKSEELLADFMLDLCMRVVRS